MNVCMYGWTDVCTDGWMNEWMDDRMSRLKIVDRNILIN